MSQTKIALITGGSRGIGKEAALRIAEKGIDVIITYKSSESKAHEVVAAIEAKGQKAKALHFDASLPITNIENFTKDFAAYLTETYGQPKFDFLINNAGMGGHHMLGTVTEDIFDSLVQVHFKSVFFLTQTLVPLLNEKGAIVNISSGLTRFSFPGTGVYAAAKGAVEVLTRSFAVELAERKIRVNTVAPGAIQTDFNAGVTRDNPQVNKRISDITALGRPGLPEDIGGVIAFLCTEDAYWINAQRMEVSGGMGI